MAGSLPVANGQPANSDGIGKQERGQHNICVEDNSRSGENVTRSGVPDDCILNVLLRNAQALELGAHLVQSLVRRA